MKVCSDQLDLSHLKFILIYIKNVNCVSIEYKNSREEKNKLDLFGSKKRD